jgi:choline dehydrogenase-like flavoprotein
LIDPGPRDGPDPAASAEIFDAVVIGTGFGGAVAACRLAQAGKKVCVLERGRRYGPGDFPRPAKRRDDLPQTARWAWALDHGLLDVQDLQGVLAVHAAGYGGGSLVYANVHLRAPPHVFAAPTRHGLNADGWPRCYTREKLDPYYDIVAAALRVRPFPGTPPSAPAPKADVMRSVAQQLRREEWFFLPPLAIDFEKCVGCGECVAGCQIQAKNTLDLNYLAAAEQAGDVDVRTLSEATGIREEDGSYSVTYRDHVDDAKVTLRAKSVFLCAGALNSTQLLLRSEKDLPSMRPESRRQIGRRFFGNGDALAIVFDTTKGPAPTPTKGPTITTTLLYTGGPSGDGGTPADWFVLQEGGYPEWLAPAVGLFRGEFWLGRNRIERAQDKGARSAAFANRDFRERAKKTGHAVHHLLRAKRAFRTPRESAAFGVDSIVPRQILELVVPYLKRYLRDGESREAYTISHAVLEEVSRRVSKANLLLGIMVNVAKKWIKPHLLPSTLEILDLRMFDAPRGTKDPLAAEVLGPALLDRAASLLHEWSPSDRAMLMLAVGVDAAPGRLFLDDNARLFAYWDLADNVPFSTAQERLMRDVAAALGGELRLNPDAVVRQRPVTVHCLGGCAMADRPEDGVTDPNGKVWGTRALYVLDGAAIPSSLGTNPSATIAAVAERNVRAALQDRGSPIYSEMLVPVDRGVPGWPADMTVAEIQRRLGQTPEILDPIRSTPTRASPPPAAPPVGLKFEEIMQGFCSAAGADGVPIRMKIAATIGDLSAFLVDPLHRIALEGTVTLGRLPGAAEYRASGTLELFRPVSSNKAMRALFREALRVLRAPGAARNPAAAMEVEALLDALKRQARRYEMAYELELHGPEPWTRLSGVKKVYGGPGRDAWTETTVLEIALLGADGVPKAEGSMHLHIADFLAHELPSFQVTGADGDELRIAWAFARFLRFFLGTLRQVYLPGIDSLDPFGPRRP